MTNPDEREAVCGFCGASDFTTPSTQKGDRGNVYCIQCGSVHARASQPSGRAPVCANCLSCGEPLTQSRFVKADWFCTNRVCHYANTYQPDEPPTASAPPRTEAPTLFEDICPRCLAVSMVDGNLPAGQFCARCSPSADTGGAAETATPDTPQEWLRAADVMYPGEKWEPGTRGITMTMLLVYGAKYQVRALLARLAESEASGIRWELIARDHFAQLQVARDELAALTESETALRFYADPNSYSIPVAPDGDGDWPREPSPIEADGGDRAIAALRKPTT